VFDAFSDLIIGITPLKTKKESVCNSPSFFNRINPFANNKRESSQSEKDDMDQEEVASSNLLDKHLSEEEKLSPNSHFISTKVSDIENGKVPGFLNVNQDATLYIPKKYICEANPEEDDLVKLLQYHFHTELLNNIDNHYKCEKCRKIKDLTKIK